MLREARLRLFLRRNHDLRAVSPSGRIVSPVGHLVIATGQPFAFVGANVVKLNFPLLAVKAGILRVRTKVNYANIISKFRCAGTS